MKNERLNIQTPRQGLKYLSRCTYYGRLIDWEYVSEAMILKFAVYTACEYYGGSTTIRIYVPTDLESEIINELVTGDYYYVITVPYKVKFQKKYQHRVDLLLNLFKEVI